MQTTYLIATGLISMAAGYGISRSISNAQTVKALNRADAIEGEFSAYRQRVEALTSAAPDAIAKFNEIGEFLAVIAKMAK